MQSIATPPTITSAATPTPSTWCVARATWIGDEPWRLSFRLAAEADRGDAAAAAATLAEIKRRDPQFTVEASGAGNFGRSEDGAKIVTALMKGHAPLCEPPNRAQTLPPSQRLALCDAERANASRGADEHGVGVAVLPDYVAQPESGLVRLLQQTDMPEMDCFLVYGEELKNAARVQAFRGVLVAAAQRWRYRTLAAPGRSGSMRLAAASLKSRGRSDEMPTTTSEKAAMDSAVRHLVSHYSPHSNRVGWLMMASILVEAWDLYGIAFVLIFIRDQYHPDPFLLGLAGAGTQGGALVGAIIGGWLTDKIGRRFMFLATMIMFIVLAIAQAFVGSVAALAAIRFFLGIPLGSDISTGYTYIMDAMAKGRRDVMGNRWQFMFAVGEVLTLAVIAIFLAVDLNHEWVWRLTLALGAVPALVILIMRHDLPETAVWLVRQGRFREAKQVASKMYGDSLDMLPDRDVEVAKPRPAAFLADIRQDPVRWRATLYGWIACFAQGSEFSTFAFYLPVLFVMVGVSSILGTNLVTMALYVIAAISGWVGPLLTPRLGHRGIAIAGFAIVLVSLLVAAGALYTHNTILLPFAAAAMLWGHYWDASNCMTIPSMMAKPEYRGTASGFAYMFVKLPSFLAIFLFPAIFTAIGQANATLLVAVFPLIGLLAAIFILPEVYGYEHDAGSEPAPQPA